MSGILLIPNILNMYKKSRLINYIFIDMYITMLMIANTIMTIIVGVARRTRILLQTLPTFPQLQM